VARKRRRKRSWLRTVLLFILTPLVVWFLAFLLWLYWDDITDLFTRDQKSLKSPPSPPRQSEKVEQPTKNKSAEKILDEDRKKLDEIIKRRE